MMTLKDTNTFGRISVDKGSARRRDLNLTIHNTQKRLEDTNPQSQQATHSFDRASTGTGTINSQYDKKINHS